MKRFRCLRTATKGSALWKPASLSGKRLDLNPLPLCLFVQPFQLAAFPLQESRTLLRNLRFSNFGEVSYQNPDFRLQCVILQKCPVFSQQRLTQIFKAFRSFKNHAMKIPVKIRGIMLCLSCVSFPYPCLCRDTFPKFTNFQISEKCPANFGELSYKFRRSVLQISENCPNPT